MLEALDAGSFEMQPGGETLAPGADQRRGGCRSQRVRGSFAEGIETEPPARGAPQPPPDQRDVEMAMGSLEGRLDSTEGGFETPAGEGKVLGTATLGLEPPQDGKAQVDP